MKKTILTMLALFMTSQSNALIADKFKCSFEIKDLKMNNISKQDKEFFIARLPQLQNTDPGISLTIGQTIERLTLNTAEAKFGANLNFYFKHALRTDLTGSLEARQLTCIGLTTDYCKNSTGSGGIIACSQGTVMCRESQASPFDPNNGWATALMSGAGPLFNQNALAPVSRDIKDDSGNIVGVANLNCQHLGTFN
jgi:hypothetical protein